MRIAYERHLLKCDKHASFENVGIVFIYLNVKIFLSTASQPRANP